MTETMSYDADFHAWALHNAELLREGRFSEADVTHIGRRGPG